MSDLAALGRLLLPPDPAGADARAADARAADSWRALLAPPPPGPDGPVPPGLPQLRGHDPAPAGTGVLPLLTHAARREAVLAVLRRRPPGGFTRTRVLRTRPPVMSPGVLGSARSSLAAGAAVLLADDAPPASVLDEVVAAAGIDTPEHLRPGSGGVLLVRGRRAGRRVLLRVGPATAVTQASVDALRTLARSPVVPELLADGQAAGLRWTLEGLLPGRRPGRLGATTVREAVAFAAALPARPGHAASAARPDGPVAPSVDVVARALPVHAAELAQVAGRALDRVGALPSVAVHGDFWQGNLLVARGHLTGVVDWDAFRPAGPAGVDLLHLVATSERRRRGEELGPHVLRRPWLSAPFTSVAAAYWRVVGAEPGPGELDALGVVWWLDQVAGTFARLPATAGDARWVDANVTAVLRVLRDGAGTACA